MTKKLIALALCLALTMALAAGCGSQIKEYEPTPDPLAETTDAPEQTDDAEPTDAPDETAEGTPAPTPDPGLGYAAFDPDELVATYNGTAITWREYYYWLNYYVGYVQYMTAMGAPFSGWDGNDYAADISNQDLVVLSARESMFPHHALEDLAEEMGFGLDEADQQGILEIFEQNADDYGDGDGTCTQEETDAFEEYLEGQFVDRAYFDYISGIELLSEKVFPALYGEDGADLPDEEVLSFAEDQSVMACKHILFMTVDRSTGEPLEDDVVAEQKAKADEVYAQLAAVADDKDALLELFDQLMNEYSEDAGLSNYPDGYIFVPGVMVPAFEQTTMSLEEYGLSEPVDSSYGYHIILRLPVDPDGTYTDASGASGPLRAAAASAAFSQRLADIVAEAEIVWEPDFDPMDFTAVFGQ